MAAAVLVVELGLGDRVVDVDGREEQLAVALHLVEPVDAGGRLLGDAADVVGDGRPAPGVLGQAVGEHPQDHGHLLGLRPRRVGHRPGLLELDPLVDQQGGVAAVVEDHGGTAFTGPAQGLLGAPPVLLEGLALPGEDRHAGRAVHRPGGTDGHSRCRMVLGGEDVAAGPPHRAPSAVRVSMSTAVWTVMCSDPVMRAPARGCEAPNSARMAISPGISCSASSISLRPKSASDRSATFHWACPLALGIWAPSRSTVLAHLAARLGEPAGRGGRPQDTGRHRQPWPPVPGADCRGPAACRGPGRQPSSAL